MSRKRPKRTKPTRIYQVSEFKEILHERYHSLSSDLIKIIEGSEDQDHPLVYIVAFATGVNRIEVMYEVRDCDIFLYRVRHGEAVAKSGDLIGSKVFAEIYPEAENLYRDNLFDRALDMNQRLVAMFVLLEILSGVDLGDLMK